MRGNAGEPILVIVLLVSLFMGGMLTLYIVGQFQAQIQPKLAAAADDPTLINNMFMGVEAARVAVGKGIMFITFVIIAASLALAYLVPAHPLMIIVSFILGAFAVVMSVIAQSIIQAAITALPALATQIQGSVWFWNNIPVIMAVYVSALIFLLYYGWSQGGAG